MYVINYLCYAMARFTEGAIIITTKLLLSMIVNLTASILQAQLQKRESSCHKGSSCLVGKFFRSSCQC